MSSRLSGNTMNSWNPSIPAAAISAGASRSKNCAIPPGAPEAIRHLFDNPIQLGQSQAALAQQMAGLPNGPALLETLMAAVRASLAQGMHVIFLGAAGVMACAFVLNLLLPEVPLRAKVSVAVPQE